MICVQLWEFMEVFLLLFVDILDDCDLVLVLFFMVLLIMVEFSQNFCVCLLSQNVYWEGQGVFIGEIFLVMFKEYGVIYMIVGYSELWKYFSESDEQINYWVCFL